jgi:uncharacterized protein (DUF1800 family)
MVAAHCLAQTGTETDPNSPTPILMTEPGTERALAAAESPKALEPDSYGVVFVRNISVMVGEGSTAFRVYAEDARGRRFRFPVLGLRMYDRRNRIYALTFQFEDELSGGDRSPEPGDLLVSVAWRGLESNRVTLKFGKTGEPLKVSTRTVEPAIQASTADDVTSRRWTGDRARFLEQATFGSTPALEQRVYRLGIRTWLVEQFELPYPSAANPYPNFPLKPTNPPADCNGLVDADVPDPDPFCFANHYSMYPVQNWFYKEAIYGDAQLRHRVAWALAQLWVISGVEVQQSSHMTAYHKVLSRNAFGNWRTLMQEMTLNPGMGGYLNMRTSTRFSPNENYAREILQLFNTGLFMLNPDGTFRLDGQGNPIATYDQDTVNNFTQTLTGWTLCESNLTLCPNRVPGAPNYIDPMIMSNPNNHDLSAKTLLAYPGSTTTNIPACTDCTGTAITTYADSSLNQALDNIYGHPNVAPFVSKFLIQQLVTGDPTPAYVGRVAAVFNANRTSPTQMKEVVRAILLDPEARGDIKTDPGYGKLREPVLFFTNVARQFDARSADRSGLSDGVVTSETNTMGQVAFMSPSVFNFYPPDYVGPGTSFVGPEFALFTTRTAVTRINLVNTLVFNRIEPNSARRVTAGTSISLADLAAIAEIDPSGNSLMDVLTVRMMPDRMSPQMRSTILNVVLTVPASNPLLRAKRAVYLVATSSQYQVQR